MHVPLTEPTAPRYITIKQETNQIHLMVPVVGGQEISTDNTCQATVALRAFFDGGAVRELNAYKEALAFDIQLLDVDHPERLAKKARLAQIDAYIGAVSAMQQSYGDAMTAFMTKPSNLYGIQLRPRIQDSQSRVVNPAFNIQRRNDARGNPLSALYNAMHSTFPDVMIAVPDPRTRLTTAVLSALSASPRFEDIQNALREQCSALYGLSIDFTQRADSSTATKADIDALMGFGNNTTSQDYIDALLGVCAPDVWGSILTPPFYSIPGTTALDERTERLSILTQFFLSIVTIYCQARGISTENFGTILDASSDLSNDLVCVVTTALRAGDEVDGWLCTFCNAHAAEFGLSRTLRADDVAAIKNIFERTYRTVTATNENPHMDDFMLLDCDATGETAKFVIHQGAICTVFAQIVDAALPNQDYFASIRADFAGHPAEMPHKNEWIATGIDLAPEDLVIRITDDQFQKIPDVVKVACCAHPTLQRWKFLHDVAKGRQDEANTLLKASPDDKQILIRTPGVFTDYSGRTFNCTAYEYAYWAKDTHMCRMLERHMNDETKAHMLARIDEIERIDAATDQPGGLVYHQRGTEHRSAHFDLTPLKDALQRYVDNYNNWWRANNRDAMNTAWMDVGMAQRDLPAHVVNEYCRPDRSFDNPDFNEENLPRSVRFYNTMTSSNAELFPLDNSRASGLGVSFALIRGRLATLPHGGLGIASSRVVSIDLEAVIRLGKTRTINITHSRENLLPTGLELNHRMR